MTHSSGPDDRQPQPPTLRPRPRLRRLHRGVVAAAGLVALAALLVLTLRYSRQAVAQAGSPVTTSARPTAPPLNLRRLEELARAGQLGPGAPPTPPRESPAEPLRDPMATTESPFQLPLPDPFPGRPESLLPDRPSRAFRSPLLGSGATALAPPGRAGSPEAAGELRPGRWRDLHELATARPTALQPATPPEADVASAPVGTEPNRASEPAGAVRLARPNAPLVLSAGTWVPAVLEHQVVSDQPGLLRAVVSRDVLDSRTASQVVIPRGSILLGQQTSVPSLGQGRLAVAWTRVLLPSGGSLEFGDDPHPSASVDGSLGLTGRRNDHWGRRFGSAILLSLVSAGVQLSQQDDRSGAPGSYPDPGEVAAGALGLELGRTSQELLRQYADLPPTISLEPGTRLHLVVARDLLFPSSP